MSRSHARTKVLALSASDWPDPCVDRVAAEIAARGGALYRFDTDRFPTSAQATLHISDAGGTDGLYLDDGDGATIDLEEIGAVWMRQMDPGAQLPDTMDPSYREAARGQTDHAVWSMVECLDVFQLDPPDALAMAPHKPRQLQLARAAGLAVPRSLLTNDADRVRAFARTLDHGVVAKLIDPSSLSVETDDREEPVYTRALSDDDLAALDALHLGPMLFQERVPRARELRVTVVGAEVFAAAVEATDATRDEVDWRRRDSALAGGFVAHELDSSTRRSLITLLDRLELNFATIDLIVRPDGVPVFLEVNTTSYFDFVEDATGLPISAAIADLLLGRTSPRVEPRG